MYYPLFKLMISRLRTVVRLLPCSVTLVAQPLLPCQTLILTPLAMTIRAREMLQFVLAVALAINRPHVLIALLFALRVTPTRMGMWRFAFKATVWSTTVGAQPLLTTSQSTRIMTSQSSGTQMFLGRPTTPKPTLDLSLPPKTSCAIFKEHQALTWALGVNMKNIPLPGCDRCLLHPVVGEEVNRHRVVVVLVHRNKCSLLLASQSLEASFSTGSRWATWMQSRMKLTLWMIASSTLHQQVKCTTTV